MYFSLLRYAFCFVVLFGVLRAEAVSPASPEPSARKAYQHTHISLPPASPKLLDACDFFGLTKERLRAHIDARNALLPTKNFIDIELKPDCTELGFNGDNFLLEYKHGKVVKVLHRHFTCISVESDGWLDSRDEALHKAIEKYSLILARARYLCDYKALESFVKRASLYEEIGDHTKAAADWQSAALIVLKDPGRF